MDVSNANTLVYPQAFPVLVPGWMFTAILSMSFKAESSHLRGANSRL